MKYYPITRLQKFHCTEWDKHFNLVLADGVVMLVLTDGVVMLVLTDGVVMLSTN